MESKKHRPLPFILLPRGNKKYYGTIIESGLCQITIWGDYRMERTPTPSIREKGYARPYVGIHNQEDDEFIDISGNHYEDSETLVLAEFIVHAANNIGRITAERDALAKLFGPVLMDVLQGDYQSIDRLANETVLEWKTDDTPRIDVSKLASVEGGAK